MIKVNRRTEIPNSIKNDGNRKKKYLQKVSDWNANNKQGKPPEPPYRQDDIKVALMEDFNSKCAYCEQKLERQYLAIEHILPKSRVPEKALNWDNFVLACGRCNSQKGAYYDTNLPLIDPCIEDPKIFFNFKFEEDEITGNSFVLILRKDDSLNGKRAQATIDNCDLNRDHLRTERAEEKLDAEFEKSRYDGHNINDRYHRKYVLKKNEQKYLATLDFFNILPQ